MKFLSAFVLGLILFSPSFAQENVIDLRNADVLSMIAAKVPADVIINKIETSRCFFDTFPTVISELRYRGVSEEILIAMVAAPIGRPTRKENTRSESPPQSSLAVPATKKSEMVTSGTHADQVSPAQTEKKPSASATSATVTNPVSSAQTDKKPSDSATSATVTNAVSSAQTDKKPSDSATSATVTNAVSSAQTEKKPSTSADMQSKSAEPTLASSQAVAATEQFLTNDDLIKLLRGGTPAPDIVKRVKSAKGNYDFSGKALFALQQAGADATIFLSMMEASRAVQKERDEQNHPLKPSKP